MALTKAAIAKQDYYNKQAKAGKITAAQAKSMGAPLSSKISTPVKTTKSSPSSNFSQYTNMDWASGAAAAKKAGIDISTGSALDLAMNAKYDPANYARLTGNEAPQQLEKTMGYIATPQYQSEINKNSGKPTSNKSFAAKSSSYNSAAPSNISVPISNRQTASTFQTGLNNALGIPTAQASTSVPKPTNGTLSQGHTPGIMGQISNGIGAVGNYFQGTGAGQIWNDIGGLLGTNNNSSPATDQPTGTGSGNTQYYNNYVPKDTSGNIFSDYNPATGASVDNQLGYSINSNNYNSQADSLKNMFSSPVQNNQVSQNRTPQQVSQPTPFYQPQSTQLSSIFQPQFQPQSIDYGQQDNSPLQGTQRMAFGNGSPMSNGAYSNGQGNYGIQGTYGTGADNTSWMQDALNNVLGIQTAQAQEIPQASQFSPQLQDYGLPMMTSQQQQQNYNMDSGMGLSGVTSNYLGGGVSNNGGLTAQSMGLLNSMVSAGEQNRTNQVKPQVMNNGGVTQQYAQPAQQQTSNSMNVQNQMMKGYGAQEKAQKKALDELIKSIKNQYSTQTDALNNSYNTQQTTGTNDLNNAKQQDLLKLSGLFSFAGQDPNSEQRIQYEQRANNDYAKQQSDFLAKLAASKGIDMGNLTSAYNTNTSSAKQGYQGQLASIAGNRNNTQLEIAKMQDALQSASLKSSAASAGLNSNAVGSLQQYLSQNRGQDGYVSPDSYAQAQQAFAQDYPSKASSFAQLFPVHQYLSPQEYKNIYGSSQQPINIDFGNYSPQ